MIDTSSEAKKEIVFPAHDYLEDLQKLLDRGDLDAVVTITKEIAAKNPGKYDSFCKQIEELAEDFQFTQIETLLNITKKVQS